MDLLERQEQLDELSRLLREAGKSAGKVAFVRGEAGAGKSSLVEQFASLAAGAPVYWGHCDALQTSRVLGPVKELAVEAGSALDSELPRDKLFSRLFEQFSPPNPLCIVVLEDLHWADEATLDFVRFVGRRIQRTRCLVVATFRDDEVGPLHPLRGVLGELTGQHVARIAVPALSLAAVQQLAEGTLRDAGHIYRVSEGNPFFVRELLSAPLDTIPETVRDAVLARLLQCSPAALELAELVSLVPGRADNWLTSALLGDTGVVADEAVARGLLRHHDAALGFRHELGRLAVESTIPRARARSMHRSILEHLVKRDADVSRLVHHASQAEDVDSVLRYAPRAAQQAAFAGAHREAIAHLGTALRHAEALAASERARLFKFHAAECNTANRISSSLESANRALGLYRELGDRAAQANSLLLLGRGYWKLGKADLAKRHIADAIALLENGPESRELAMAYSMHSQLAMTAQRTDEALSYGQRAFDLATRFDDHEVRAHALNNLGTALLNAGDFSGLEKLESSLAVALEHNLQDHAGRAYANLVSSLVRQHRVELATRYISQGAAYAEVHDVQDTVVYIRAYVAQFELDRGRWEKAAQMATELVQHPSLAIAPRIPTLVALASVRARRGDPGVDPLLDEALRLALPTAELQRIGPVAALRAEVAWYRGERERAAREAALGLKAAEGRSDRWLIGQLAYWAHRAAPGTALPREIAEPYALMIEGKWEAAADVWNVLEAPYERALALADGPEEGLREALAVLEQLGAGPLQAIVRQRLRDLGVRGLPRGPRASTRAHPAGLTSREVQVLNLLVHGHTNTELARRLHLSTKTVDHHVSAILEKLQVRSRTEAVAAAFGLGIVKAAR
jgi:DNA-binding CsgD family transcriptional regulator/tetratricopeptide (TPR) repeat protein